MSTKPKYVTLKGQKYRWVGEGAPPRSAAEKEVAITMGELVVPKSRNTVSRAKKAITTGVVYKPVKTGLGYIYMYNGKRYGYPTPIKLRPPRRTAARLDKLIASGRLIEYPDYVTPLPNKRYDAPIAGKDVTGDVVYKPIKTWLGEYVYKYKGKTYEFNPPRMTRPSKLTVTKLKRLIKSGKLQEAENTVFMGQAPNKRYDAPKNERVWETREKRQARLAARSEAMKGQKVTRGAYGQPRKSKYYKLNGVSYVWVGEGPPISLPTKADKIMAAHNGQIVPTKEKTIKVPLY